MNFTSSVDFASSGVQVAYDIYLQLQKYPEALRTSMMLNDRELIKATLDACKDPYEIAIFAEGTPAVSFTTSCFVGSVPKNARF